MMKIGDYCFARVRGYPAWPAKILSVLDPRPSTMKFQVHFFGTGETATVIAKEVFPYDENKERFSLKHMRRKHFSDGIVQLETERAKVTGGIAPEKSSIPQKADADTVTPLKRRRTSDMSESTPSQPPKKNRRSSAVADLKSDSQLKPGESPDQVQTSRSGRVKKPKKFFDDANGAKEDDVSKSSFNEVSPVSKSGETSLKEEEVSSVHETPSPGNQSRRKSKGVEEESSKLDAPKLSNKGRSLWVRAPTGKLVLLHIDHDVPDSFNDSPENWYRYYDEYLKKVQDKIEAGEDIPEEFARQIQLFDRSNDNVAKTSRRIIQVLQATNRYSELQLTIAGIDQNIRKCLQVNKMDVDKALEFLDQLLLINIDPLLLKKNPRIVATISKVRHYKGNLAEWNLTPEQEREFRKSAEKIRVKGQMLLNKFRAVFGIGRTDDFREQYQKIMQEYNAAIEGMPLAQVHSLICDPTAEYFGDAVKLQEDVLEEYKLFMRVDPPTAPAAASVAVAVK